VHKQAHSSFSPLTMHTPQPMNMNNANPTCLNLSHTCSCTGASRSFFRFLVHSVLPPLLPSFIHSVSPALLKAPVLASRSCVWCVSGRRHCVWGCCPGPCVSIQRSSQVQGWSGHPSSKCVFDLELIEPSDTCHSPCVVSKAPGQELGWSVEIASWLHGVCVCPAAAAHFVGAFCEATFLLASRGHILYRALSSLDLSQ